MNLLSGSYLSKVEGIHDPVSSNLFDCFDACFFYLFKCLERRMPLLELFLDDITFSLDRASDGRLLAIDFSENTFTKKIIKEHKLRSSGEEAYHKIKIHTAENRMVIVQLDFGLLPHSSFYGSELESHITELSHCLAIVGSEGDDFYFFDDPTTINRKNFIPYKANPEIGILSKKLLLKSIEQGCILTTLTISENLEGLEEHIKNLFTLMKQNFTRESSVKEGITRYYGKSALRELIDIAKSQSINLLEVMDNKVTNYRDYLGWRFSGIECKRSLLFEYLKRENSSKQEISKSLSLSRECGDRWTLLNLLLQKRIKKNKFFFDWSIVSHLEKLLTAETELNNSLLQWMGL